MREAGVARANYLLVSEILLIDEAEITTRTQHQYEAAITYTVATRN